MAANTCAVSCRLNSFPLRTLCAVQQPSSAAGVAGRVSILQERSLRLKTPLWVKLERREGEAWTFQIQIAGLCIPPKKEPNINKTDANWPTFIILNSELLEKVNVYFPGYFGY